MGVVRARQAWASAAPSLQCASSTFAHRRAQGRLAGKIGLARRKINYRLRTLEQHGLIELVAERRKGNMTERVMQATAASYVISPAGLGAVAPDPARTPDRLSAASVPRVRMAAA